jgi:hypothetical protein
MGFKKNEGFIKIKEEIRERKSDLHPRLKVKQKLAI